MCRIKRHQSLQFQIDMKVSALYFEKIYAMKVQYLIHIYKLNKQHQFFWWKTKIEDIHIYRNALIAFYLCAVMTIFCNCILNWWQRKNLQILNIWQKTVGENTIRYYAEIGMIISYSILINILNSSIMFFNSQNKTVQGDFRTGELVLD